MLAKDSKPLSSSARRVQEALEGLGMALQVVELPASTRTAQEAAHAIGCKVGQIAKSLVFKIRESGRPILVIASGVNRVNENTLASFVGGKISKADADFVRQHTGFAIGGVPPVGHLEPLEIFIDRDLLTYCEIWVAAGTPHAVFKLTGDDLVAATGGQVISVTGVE
jgi:prolyl-tRNA editing enzyme YbaK/EbsC (Cys-tRNA(Pro) deacylase)